MIAFSIFSVLLLTSSENNSSCNALNKSLAASGSKMCVFRKPLLFVIERLMNMLVRTLLSFLFLYPSFPPKLILSRECKPKANLFMLSGVLLWVAEHLGSC